MTALATSLMALGRTGEATREALAARESFLALGAESEASRAKRLLDALGEGRTTSPGITKRERDVLRLLAEGMTNRQIAKHLMVSEHTAHRHVTSILRKLDLSSRTAAAAPTDPRPNQTLRPPPSKTRTRTTV